MALERSAARHARGEFTAGRDATVLAGDAGALTLATGTGDGDGVGTAQVTWLPTDGEPLAGPVLAWDGGPLDVDIVADPVGGGFVVTLDGEVALFAGDPPDLSASTPGPSFIEHPVTTPICADLATRLGP